MRHHYRFKRYGDPLGQPVKDERERSYVTPAGYRTVLHPNHPNADKQGYVLEHRFVMSELLGRPLLPHESVHHLNGDRLDNRVKNLELWSKSQPPGQRVKDKVTWAREIIALYGEPAA